MFWNMGLPRAHMRSFIACVMLLQCSHAVNVRTEMHYLRVSHHPHADHRVERVPGYDAELKSRQYAGYLEVDKELGTQLFYYFVESENDPKRDPVVLWMNGGPGCSSFDGFVYEHGPFNFRAHGDNSVRLTENKYSWSKAANMLYLDSPAGVGLSYSEHGERHGYSSNDTKTAEDANSFLRLFFQKYPRFLKNEFFISGESYAGIYVPNLARRVVTGNRAGETPNLNLVGYLVGNGCTDEEVDGNAFPLFAVGKSLVPYELYQRMQDTCAGNFWNATEGSECEKLLASFQRDLSGLNIYDVLEQCYDDDEGDQPQLLQARRDRYRQLRGSYRQWPVAGGVRSGAKVLNWAHLLGHNPPCTTSRLASIWLNNPRVRLALHAEPSSKIGRWTICSDRLDYTHDEGSMLPIHSWLIQEARLRALIYSGDHDLCVPHTGSEAWTRGMGYKVAAEWAPWFLNEREVGGYVVEFEGPLTYATIKGAGHMVPMNKPREGLRMFERFLAGKPLTDEQGAQ